MANTLTPTDVHKLMNAIASQATGESVNSVVDTTTFTSVGETVLRTGYENTMNAISTVLAETIFSVRPYKGKLDSIRVAQQRWGLQVRKITPLYSEAEASEDMNTDHASTQLNDGQAIDMYKIKSPKALQLNFYGTKLLQKHITRWKHQLDAAMQNESQLLSFVDAVMIEFQNEIELLNESETRATLLNAIGGLYEMNTTGCVRDLVAEYNTKFGTTYTRAQLLSTYVTDFMKFVAAQIKVASEQITDMSAMYHAQITGKGKILRHTPKGRQKMIMYNPIFIEAESQVYSGLFNPQYLDIGKFEGVNFWQSKLDPTRVNVKANYLNVTTGESANSDGQNIPFVLGLLFDEEALGIMPQFDYASTTPMNSAGGYFNTYYHWKFNSYVDFTENMILFVLGEGGAPAQEETPTATTNSIKEGAK